MIFEGLKFPNKPVLSILESVIIVQKAKSIVKFTSKEEKALTLSSRKCIYTLPRINEVVNVRV